MSFCYRVGFLKAKWGANITVSRQEMLLSGCQNKDQYL
ncbi:hypothetical protein PTET_b0432 [Pseudoalteromonas tetraodonis]|nr:hypothetical protein PTET_b0432 [Pseudoalteromonas tetraodonis]